MGRFGSLVLLEADIDRLESSFLSLYGLILVGSRTLPPTSVVCTRALKKVILAETIGLLSSTIVAGKSTTGSCMMLSASGYLSLEPRGCDAYFLFLDLEVFIAVERTRSLYLTTII